MRFAFFICVFYFFYLRFLFLFVFYFFYLRFLFFNCVFFFLFAFSFLFVFEPSGPPYFSLNLSKVIGFFRFFLQSAVSFKN